MSGSEKNEDGEDGRVEEKEKAPRTFPDLKQKPAGKQLRKPPPKLTRTKGNGGDLRSAALKMHCQMREMWSSPSQQAPKITKILIEEVEGEALSVGLSLIVEEETNTLDINKLKVVRQLATDIAKQSSLEFSTITERGVTLSWIDVEVLKKAVGEELKQRLDTLEDASNNTIQHKPLAPPTFSFKYQIVANTDKGVRTSNEDEYIILEHYNDLLGLTEHPKQIFFGLYDGHSGKQAADYCKTHLHVNIGREESFKKGNIDTALHNGFLKTDMLFNKKAEVDGVNDGTTAMVALLCEDTLTVANCGDAKGFLCRGKEMVSLCTIHNPNREDEKERVKKAGGTVVWYGTWRVNGVLAVSRSIGDKALKEILIAEPEVQHHCLRPGEDEFFILATDGLWDIMDENQAAQLVKEIVQEQGREHVSKILVDIAVNKRNSKDNVTVIVVFLDWFESSSQPHMIINGSSNNSEDNSSED